LDLAAHALNEAAYGFSGSGCPRGFDPIDVFGHHLSGALLAAAHSTPGGFCALPDLISDTPHPISGGLSVETSVHGCL
jgi:hypothetical protein